MDLFEFFESSKEEIKQTLANGIPNKAFCSFRHHCNILQDPSFCCSNNYDCDQCPYFVTKITNIQLIRSLWVYANIQKATWTTKVKLWSIVYDLVGSVAPDKVTGLLTQIQTLNFRKTFQLIETLVDICNEIEEKSNGHI